MLLRESRVSENRPADSSVNPKNSLASAILFEFFVENEVLSILVAYEKAES
jgi:hypothetical protein